MYQIQEDSASNKYVTITNKEDELVRITLVQHGWTGGPCLRLQIQTETGRLKQGPEFPIGQLGELTLAATKLIFES
jgi:hypothetical protein